MYDKQKALPHGSFLTPDLFNRAALSLAVLAQDSTLNTVFSAYSKPDFRLLSFMLCSLLSAILYLQSSILGLHPRASVLLPSIL